MDPLYIGLIVLASLIVICFLISLIAYYIVFYNNHKHHDTPYRDFDEGGFKDYKDDINKCIDKALSFRPNEEVYIKSFDHKKLHGYLFISDLNNPWTIAVHGYKGNCFRDMCGYLRIALTNKLNVLLIEHRGHGKSSGHTITFGVKEHQDLICWINYLDNRYHPESLFVCGVSMGASTTLMLANKDLPKCVKGLIADAPYTSPKEICYSTASTIKGFPKWMYGPMLYLGAFLIAHFNLSKGNVIECVKHTKLPILIVHGNKDSIVPYYMGEEIYKSNPKDVRFVPINNADHCMSFFVDENKVTNEEIDFINKYK